MASSTTCTNDILYDPTPNPMTLPRGPISRAYGLPASYGNGDSWWAQVRRSASGPSAATDFVGCRLRTASCCRRAYSERMPMYDGVLRTSNTWSVLRNSYDASLG